MDCEILFDFFIFVRANRAKQSRQKVKQKGIETAEAESRTQYKVRFSPAPSLSLFIGRTIPFSRERTDGRYKRSVRCVGSKGRGREKKKKCEPKDKGHPLYRANMGPASAPATHKDRLIKK